MKIVIDIPKEMILSLEQGSFGAKYNIYDLIGRVMNGTPLPKGHGRLIDADRLQDNISRDEREALTKHQVWLKASIYNPEAQTIIEADKGSESE